MSRLREREALKRVYRSKRWAAKVDRMPDEQVIAITLRLRSQGVNV